MFHLVFLLEGYWKTIVSWFWRTEPLLKYQTTGLTWNIEHFSLQVGHLVHLVLEYFRWRKRKGNVTPSNGIWDHRSPELLLFSPVPELNRSAMCCFTLGECLRKKLSHTLVFAPTPWNETRLFTRVKARHIGLVLIDALVYSERKVLALVAVVDWHILQLLWVLSKNCRAAATSGLQFVLQFWHTDVFIRKVIYDLSVDPRRAKHTPRSPLS